MFVKQSTVYGWVLTILFYFFSNLALAATDIVVDGNVDDWREADRLDLGSSNRVDGYQLYGRYKNDVYYLLLKSESKQIGHFSTIWLNTDQNNTTGYQIFGSTGGMERYVEVNADKKAFIYQVEPFGTNGVEIASEIKASEQGSVWEMAIPLNALGMSEARAINLLLDVNNEDFIPAAYLATNQYVLRINTAPDLLSSDEKRIGIVYSDTNAQRFWSVMGYSHLFMSVQSQAVQAGVPFDLLTEADLTDLNKLIRYQTLVFPNFSHVQNEQLAEIEHNLQLATNYYKVGIITAGNFLTNQADGSSLSGDAYMRMKSLLGVQREDGIAAQAMAVRIADIEHPITKDVYQLGDQVIAYPSAYSGYFSTTNAYPTDLIATMHVDGLGVKNAVLATTVGGRNVHFASLGMMSDTNLLWSAIRWSVFGDSIPATLQISRQPALFAARNDMDQSMFISDIETTEKPLLELLIAWKESYDFVGSYYLNVGENPSAGEYTDWSISTPLYQQYLDLGNEIGTHSYNHPHDTNVLDAETLRHEFADSRSVIEQNLGLENIGAAVPGAPEDFRTANEILQHVSYLSGGYSSTGAGFPNAFGYLTPNHDKVYLAPNMTFDFTNIQFLGLTAEETKTKWFNEFDTLTKYASLPILHWPWHDYGPTSSLSAGYTVDMFESLIKKASDYRVEFVTVDDLRRRLEHYRDAQLVVKQTTEQQLDIQVQTPSQGQFAVELKAPIRSVENWYAYDEKKVFLAKDTENLTVNLGENQDTVTRIYSLPARAKLLSLSGDGQQIQFQFEGEGKVELYTKCATPPHLSTSSQVITRFVRAEQRFMIDFQKSGTHHVNLDGCPTNVAAICEVKHKMNRQTRRFCRSHGYTPRKCRRHGYKGRHCKPRTRRS